MFKIESYVTPILLSYVDKYVRDFKPGDAQVSLWGGGVALHNLVLKGDVLQHEVSLPFTLVSGRIHELLIHVPWTKIMSEPIVVTIDTIECVLSLNPPVTPDGSSNVDTPSRKAQVVEAPPGYMQALVRRIVSNISLRVHHLIVKYVQDDIVMSLNVKHLAVESAGPNWEPAFADIDQNQPVIRRLVRLDDLTLCLDKSDIDGKIRFFEEPLLYRCQLNLRVLTRLISANTRRATSLNVQLRSSRLAWSISNEQLILLLRLLREHPVTKEQPTPPKQSVAQTPMSAAASNSAEPARRESWSEWAWSWLPTWIDSEGGVEEPPVPPTPLPLFFNAYLDQVSLAFKVLEIDANNRKRSRPVLEVSATYVATKAALCMPTSMRVRFGARELLMGSQGKCVCGRMDLEYQNQPAMYLKRIYNSDDQEAWSWPEEDLNEKIETGEAVDETFSASPEQSGLPEGGSVNQGQMPNKAANEPIQDKPEREEVDELWNKMSPVLYVEYIHDRSPPNPFTNPYDNPPKDFEYSDWVEKVNMSIHLEPIEVQVCTGLMHRLSALKSIYRERPYPTADQPMRVLTVEENEYLSENLPQKRIMVEARGVILRIIPWNHGSSDKSAPVTIALDLELPKCTVAIVAPLYPHRVCSAACQMPDDTGPLWQGARRHITVTLAALQAQVCAPLDKESRPCARADIKLVTHQLLHKLYFKKRESVEFSYNLKIRELTICGSSPRLQTALLVPLSLYQERRPVQIKHTTLVADAVSDEESVAIDFNLEDFAMRGFLTKNINTHVISLQSAKATAHHAPKGGEIKQAWLFSAPEAPTTTPFLRLGIQWCKKQVDNSFDYCGMWTEPMAISIDPLLITWLAYKPAMKPDASVSAVFKTNSQYFERRRYTPPSSSGRGASKTASLQGAELVHLRSRSQGSSVELSEKKETKMPIIPIQQQKSDDSWLSEERMVTLHKRLRTMLLNIELGLVLVYVTMSTASAIDCDTLRAAMDRHATESHRVLGISFGKLSVHSSSAMAQLWQELRHDGPTFVKTKPNTESFPWKLSLAGISCYTLEPRSAPVESQDKSGSSTGLKSRLKTRPVVSPRIVLDLVSTSVTVSVVTKSIQYKSMTRKDMKTPGVSTEERMTRYFTSGTDFRPSSLKEFVRGPSGGRKQTSSEAVGKVSNTAITEVVTIKDGPMVSLGVHLHADTPPLVIRLEHDQLHIVTAVLHCFNHIHTLLKRPPIRISRQGYSSQASLHKPLIRCVSEMEEIRAASEDTSDSHSDLISIYDRTLQERRPMKTFYWFQWVISHATVVVASESVKLAFDIDDIISTVDIQAQYNQLKIKLASASIKHYERSGTNEWSAGTMAGRVLAAREPTNSKEDAHFLSITVTQARVSKLPTSWKEELHPKLLEQNNSSADNVWEVYATLAPLEAVLQPAIMENVMSLVNEMAPRAFCPLKGEIDFSEAPPIVWPFFYITAGGLRLLVTGEQQDSKDLDDTFIFSIGKVNINPHPDNPICRRVVNTSAEGAWLAASDAFEGRQYQIEVKKVTVRSAKFNQLALFERSNDYAEGTASENPALKWSNRLEMPLTVPILHTIELCCVIAPALYVGNTLTCGPAVELNLVSDCSVEISVAQLELLKQILKEFVEAAEQESSPPTGLVGGTSRIGDKHGVCPYASLIIKSEANNSTESDLTLLESMMENKIIYQNDQRRSVTSDSGVETVTSSSKMKLTDDGQVKKSMSVAFIDQQQAQYLEVFVTMGVIDLALYVADDSSPEITALRPPYVEKPKPTQDPPAEKKAEDTQPQQSGTRSKESIKKQDVSCSLTEMMRETHNEQNMQLETPASELAGNVSLLHITLFQPNLYYWKSKTQKTLQLSIFNTWVALGVGNIPGQWHAVLLATAKGVSDPVTDIPPALATLKAVVPIAANFPVTTASNTGTRGSIRLDIERPVQIDISTDKLMRLKGIYQLLQDKVFQPYQPRTRSKAPLLYKWRKYLINESIESITVQTSQLSVCGTVGTMGWDSSSLQLSASYRPENMNARGLISALLVSAGPPGDWRHVVLQPLMLGAELEVSWEAWRRAEGGLSAKEPSVKVSVEVDRVTIDVRPTDLLALNQLQKSARELLKKPAESFLPSGSSETMYYETSTASIIPSLGNIRRSSSTLPTEPEATDQLYKDDLRSGAFKILNGGQLPMAYQVMLHGNAVSWSYPHPRAITRIVAFPLPGQDKEIDCVLELYISMLGRWEPHTYFKIPVREPRELNLYVPPPDSVFALMWRFRACTNEEPEPLPYKFTIKNFLPRTDPLNIEHAQEPPNLNYTNEVTAEQLSGVLRVDSYFAPRLLPRTKIIMRIANLHVYAHNSLPCLSSSSQATYLEGYYVSKPLMRTHRVLSLSACDTTMHAHVDSPAGVLFVMDTKLASDIVDCATGTMEGLVEKFRLQSGISHNKTSLVSPRTRVMTEGIHVVLQVPRLKTLQALYTDWNAAFEQYVRESASNYEYEAKPEVRRKSTQDIAAATAVELEGRVSLWIHNSCASAMRIGQEGTDEVVPLGPGTRLAYRWHNPSSPKKLRLALTGPSPDWHWSPSLPFVAGSTRLRLDIPGSQSYQLPGTGPVVHLKIEELGASRYMLLSGRLVLANMLRTSLLYKVKSQYTEAPKWRTVCSGELIPEAIGHSVVCSPESEMVLKIRFRSMNTGWSGDIPLKECPKENVPWLVKVPSDTEGQFVSVWCRVVRARTDGRILATVWPLYVLHSHLPLDTDVLIVTVSTSTSNEDPTSPQLRPPPQMQISPGRGTSTHLQASGTTAARHTLSFQYRNIECPVTREAVPLHYGVTETSVFDKRAPVAHIEDVIKEIYRWLDRSGQNVTSAWPYSLVTKHWFGTWRAASLQPRCDVTVRYQAVSAGGGCSLEILLSPVALLCNATPIALTLRAYDAAPLCRLDPGTAISPPSAVLTKPFFMSVEIGRETFVSGQLQVSTEEPGRYGTPPPGQVALDHAAHFCILCNQKVALLTLYYEIKEQINILGVSTAYMLINRLHIDLQASAIAVPYDPDKEEILLRPKVFKVVPPNKENSIHGTALCRFSLQSRWRGGDPSELRTYLCLSLSVSDNTSHSVHEAVPIRLGEPPFRRAVALLDAENTSIPVVVTQMKHDNRWLVVVARDPCPQFLVHNHTHMTLAVAQSLHSAEQPATSQSEIAPECAGARWWCIVPPKSSIHYSTPTHCARFPPAAPAPLAVTSPDMPFLTFAQGKDEKDLEWCSPVVVADGEQLLQYASGVTIKLRVRIYPHSSLLELQDVDHNDISASDIRRRLFGALSSVDGLHALKKLSVSSCAASLERVGGDSRLLRGVSDDRVLSRENVSAMSETSTKDFYSPDQFKIMQDEDHSALLLTKVGQPENKVKKKYESVMFFETSKVPEDPVNPTTDELGASTSHQLGASTTLQTRASVTLQSGASVTHQLGASTTNQLGTSVAQQLGGSAIRSDFMRRASNVFASDSSLKMQTIDTDLGDLDPSWAAYERFRCVVSSMAVEMAASSDVLPLFMLHLDRSALVILADKKKTKTILSIADAQIDNLQFDNGQYDFAVVASTRAEALAADQWPSLWTMFGELNTFATRQDSARLLLKLQHDKWEVYPNRYRELTEVDVKLGTLALYIEDAYVKALVEMSRLLVPAPGNGGSDLVSLSDEYSLQEPLRLRLLHVHPLDLTLTLHTAVRMYIALDHSPLRLSAFRLNDMMTSADRLTHALTVHYLSAAILGAGWVVGGLELLGAPGALAARLGGATGGVRGVASAAAAALLRSLSAWAGSLARNLDLLAGDEEHARRAAAARRRSPPSFVAGLIAGITNFAINILGAVGGLAHHPLVGVAVGETESGATALRRGILGALTKPLSATADLVAYAGSGLLKQTGWDPVPEPRHSLSAIEARSQASWRRDCVRWMFRLCELNALSGFQVLLDNTPLQLLLTHKFLVVVEPETECIVEMIDFRYCTLGSYEGQIIELYVTQKRVPKATASEFRLADEDDEYQISVAAMARVARYTGAEGGTQGETRVLCLLPLPGRSHSLHAALAAAVHHNTDSHFPML